MDRPGGVNFSPQVSGGYRPNANSEIRIDEMQLYNAIRDGLQFFSESILRYCVWGRLLGSAQELAGWENSPLLCKHCYAKIDDFNALIYSR